MTTKIEKMKCLPQPDDGRGKQTFDYNFEKKCEKISPRKNPEGLKSTPLTERTDSDYLHSWL